MKKNWKGRKYRVRYSLKLYGMWYNKKLGWIANDFVDTSKSWSNYRHIKNVKNLNRSLKNLPDDCSGSLTKWYGYVKGRGHRTCTWDII